jgi:histidyl-tRNA synthetase
MRVMAEMRNRGIATEIYPEASKMKKQMEYANRRGIPYVVIIGSEELQRGVATLKDMCSGEQREVALTELAQQF